MMANRWMQNLSKVDFVTSVGLYILPDRLILVRLRKNFRRVSLLSKRRVTFPRATTSRGSQG